MISQSIESLREKNAAFARNVEYLKETESDDRLDDLMESAESLFMHETMQELKEAHDMVMELSGEEDEVTESTEINRILNADHSITFYEMIGLE